MLDSEKTKEQLIAELFESRQRISELESGVLKCKQLEEEVLLNENRLHSLISILQHTYISTQDFWTTL